MPKIKVYVTLENKQKNEIKKETYIGLLNDNKITYQDEKMVTIYIESNTITMIRRDEDSMTRLLFQSGNTMGTYKLKNYPPFLLDIKTSILEMKKNQIHVCYQTKLKEELMGDFDFYLQYEVIS